MDLDIFLEKLDLSPVEKKVYALLLRGGNSKASNISRALGISTTNVYPVVNQLVEKGLVEASIARPITFAAVPLDRAYSQLILKYRKEMDDKLSDLRKAKDQLEDILRVRETRDSSFEKDRFQIIKGFNNSASRMLTALSRSEREVQLAMRRQETLQLEKAGFFDALKSVQLRKGFQARLLLDRNLRKFFGNMGKSVQVEWVKTEAITHEVVVIDDEVFYSLKDCQDPRDMLFLWTNFTKFGLMCRRIFQDLWESRVPGSEEMSAFDLTVAMKTWLTNLFEACDLPIRRDEKFTGASGIEYTVDFAFWPVEKEKPVALDVLSSRAVDPNPLINLSVKAFDIRSQISHAVLLVLGELDLTIKANIDNSILKVVEVSEALPREFGGNRSVGQPANARRDF